MMNTYTIEKFDSKNGDFEEWALDFESLAKITRCPDQDAKHLIRLYLDEPAKAVLKKLTAAELAVVDSILDALRPKLAPNFRKEEAQDALEHLKQGNRDLKQFGRLINKTVSLAYASLNDDEADKMSTKYFIRGLESELRQRLEVCNPKTYKEAIQFALQQERYLTVRMTERKDKDVRQDLAKLQNDFKNFTRTENRVSPNYIPNKAVCQLCMGGGHTAPNCKQSPVAIPVGRNNQGQLSTCQPTEKSPQNQNEVQYNINTIQVPSYVEISITIEGIPATLMVDSGSTRTVVMKDWVKSHEDNLPWALNCQPVTLVAADGVTIKLTRHL